jgi:hypothetical protein
MLRALVVETALADTLTVKFDVPIVVGVPEITPAVDSVKPAGNVPPASAHVYGATPPDAARVALYATPTVPPANDAVVIVSPTLIKVAQSVT